MLNHWGFGGVFVFNLVENLDLRQAPRKKKKTKKHLYFPPPVKLPALWLITALVDVTV